MSGRRLSVGVVVLGLMLGILSNEAEARPRFRRGSVFGRPAGRFSSFLPAFRFSSRRFPRRSIFRPPVFSPIVFPVNLSLPSQPVNPGPIHSDPGLPRNPEPVRPVRPIDPNPAPVRPSPTPGVEKLSEFCDASCPTADFNPHFCWVPRVGQLTIVPFSFTGGNLCQSMRGLCRDIRSSGQDPDSHPFICKENRSDTVVIRHEPGETGPVNPITPQPGDPSFPRELGRVKGSVLRHSGDFQPPTNEPGRGVLTVTPIPNGRVFVFSGQLGQKRDSDGFSIPRAVDTQGKTPIRTVRADGDGKFQVDLPPGTYTIVTEINGELRHTDGGFPVYPNRNWSTITISQGSEREYSIVDDQTTH